MHRRRHGPHLRINATCLPNRCVSERGFALRAQSHKNSLIRRPSVQRPHQLAKLRQRSLKLKGGDGNNIDAVEVRSLITAFETAPSRTVRAPPPSACGC